jgi:hypothetical protein
MLARVKQQLYIDVTVVVPEVSVFFSFSLSAAEVYKFVYRNTKITYSSINLRFADVIVSAVGILLLLLPVYIEWLIEYCTALRTVTLAVE